MTAIKPTDDATLTGSEMGAQSQPMQKTRLHVVIPAYNGAQWIEECVSSLLASPAIGSVTVVDNGSTDDTVAILERMDDVSVIRSPENLGFGAAINRGADTLDEHAEYLFLVNQDLVLEPGAAEELLELLEQDPELALISAMQLDWEGRQIDAAFRRQLPSALVDDLLLRSPQRLYDMTFAPAAAVVIRRDIWDQIGGFDELFFLYCEDKDLCRLLRQLGKKIAIAPHARVRHWHGLLSDSGVDRTNNANWAYSQCIYSLLGVSHSRSRWPL